MDKKDSITVWVDGKKTKIDREQINDIPPIDTSSSEHAATRETDPGDSENQTLQVDDWQHVSTGKKKKNLSRFKPYFMAILSAVFIGGVFGLIMLKLVGTLDGGASGDDAATVNQPADDDHGTEKLEGSYELGEKQAYVIQGGVFDEKKSVGDWRESFQDAGMKTFVWERSGSHYLFVDIADSEKKALKQTEDIQDKTGLDVFTKKWETAGQDIDLSQDDARWLKKVENAWQASLEKHTNGKEDDLKEWKTVLEESKGTTEDVAAVEKIISESLEQNEGSDKMDMISFLFKIWHALEHEISS